MKDQLIKSSLEVRRSTISGYGVFALKNLKQNEIIEECPALLVTVSSSDLNAYTIPWENDDMFAIPLGYGCIYHRTELPNATYDTDKNNQLITFKTLRSINKGDEIFVSAKPSSTATKSIISYRLAKKLPNLLLRIGFVLMLFFILKAALFPYVLQQKDLQPPTQKQAIPQRYT